MQERKEGKEQKNKRKKEKCLPSPNVLLNVGYYDYSLIHKLRHRVHEVYIAAVQNRPKLVLRTLIPPNEVLGKQGLV